MPENKVQIVIEVDSATGAARVKDMGNAFAGMEQRVNTLTSATHALAAGFATWKIAEFIKDSALLAARVETLGVVMGVVGRNALYTKGEMEGYVKAVKELGITTVEAQQTVIQMAQAHLDLGKAAGLARVAQDAAVIANMNSSETLQGIMHGITTLQPEILRTYGIIVNFESEYSKYAGSVGRTTESLSGQEKQQIALNAVMEAGKRIAGSYEAAMGTVGKQLTSLPRYAAALQEALGEAFKPATEALIRQAGESLKAFEKSASSGEAQTAISELANLVGQLSVSAGQTLPTALSAASITLRTFASGAITSYAAIETLGKFVGATAAAISHLAEGEFKQAWQDTQDFGRDVGVIWEGVVKKIDNLWDESAIKAHMRKAKQQADEDEATRKWMERLRVVVAEQDKLEAAQAKKKEDALKRQRDEDEAHLKKWETVKATIGVEGAAKELALLEKEYAAYKRVVDDKVALEQWFADEKQRIQLKSQNEALSLYEELYKATKLQEYADKATAATRQILDAEETKWATILRSDEDAHRLRIQREEEYVAKIKGEIKEVVAATQEGYKAQELAAQEHAAIATQAAVAAANPNIGEYTGLPVGASTQYYVVNNVAYTPQGFQSYLQQIADNTKNTATAAASSATAQQQTAIAEQQRLAEEKARRTSDLAAQGQTITDWLASLATGNLAPVQNAGIWGLQYEAKRQAALSAPENNAALGDFLGYAKDYLSFEKSAGSTASYTAVYQSITDTVALLGGATQILENLSGAGFDTTAVSLGKIIDTLGDMGVKGTESVVTLSTNVQNKLGDVGTFFDTLATKMNLNLNAVSAEQAIKNLTPAPTYGTPYTLTKEAYWDNNGVSYDHDPSFGRGTFNGWPVNYYPKHDEIWGINLVTGKPNRLAAKGALTDGLTMAGEIGPEWIVPTYEPQRSNFLRDVGVDSEAIGRALAKQLRPVLASIAGSSSGNGEVCIKLIIDSREIAHVMTKEIRTDAEVIESIRAIAK